MGGKRESRERLSVILNRQSQRICLNNQNNSNKDENNSNSKV